MFITDLPNQVLLRITQHISIISTFRLAISCKKLYERIRHLPFKERFYLRSDTTVGSFFLTSVKDIEVSIRVKDIKYHELQDKLNSFYYIQSMKINTDEPISVQSATRLLNCIPTFFSASLSLKVNHSIKSFDAAIQGCNRTDIRMVRDETIDRLPPQKRTPSPIREVEASVKRMKEWYLQQNHETSKITPLNILKWKNIINKDSKYINFEENNCDINMAFNDSREADEVIKQKLVPIFLESCIEFNHNFVFVTQFEVYFRNNPIIDANAIPTLHEPYHDTPVAVIKDKNERGNTWFELSIFFKRFEVLVTGGIVCETTSRKSSPFLGPSIPFDEMRSSLMKTSKNILTSQKKITFRAQERNLRNWMKHSSHFQWTFISKRFHDKGFCTVSPLNIKNSSNKFVNLISFILNCLSKNIYSGRNHKKTLALLSGIQFSKLPAQEVTKVAILKKKIIDVTPTYDLSIINILVELERSKNKPPISVIKPEAAVLLTSKISSYCKSQNKKALSFYTF